MQMPLAQSVLTLQILSFTHFAQVAPPQSSSLSVPSVKPFVHVLQMPVTGAAAVLLELLVAGGAGYSHWSNPQSKSTLQTLPSGHLPQTKPPQSTSLSLPSFIPSEHEPHRLPSH